MFSRVIGALCALLFVGALCSASASASTPDTPIPVLDPSCAKVVSVHEYKLRAAKIYRHRQHVGRKLRLRLRHVRSCAATPEAHARMLRITQHVKHQRKARLARERRARQRAAARKRARAQANVGYVLPAYIVQCESGGNPHAVNNNNPNRPAGLYQIITSTWLGYGGGRFAPTADAATPYQQGVIAKAVLNGQGIGAWECA